MERKMSKALREQYNMRSRDVAWVLDLSPDDVIELARKGWLKAKKDGRFWRFRKVDVMKYKRALTA